EPAQPEGRGTGSGRNHLGGLPGQPAGEADRLLQRLLRGEPGRQRRVGAASAVAFELLAGSEQAVEEFGYAFDVLGEARHIGDVRADTQNGHRLALFDGDGLREVARLVDVEA